MRGSVPWDAAEMVPPTPASMLSRLAGEQRL